MASRGSPSKSMSRPASAGRRPLSASASRPQSARLSATAPTGGGGGGGGRGGEEPRLMERGATIRSPLRRPVSKIGKQLGKFLDEVYNKIEPYSAADTDRTHIGSPPPTSRGGRGSRSPSPTTKAMMRLEADREAEATAKGAAAERLNFCTIPQAQPVKGIVLGDPVHRVAYTAGKDGMVQVWDFEFLMSRVGESVDEAVQCKQILPAQPTGVSCICLVDHRWVCTGGWNAEVKVWDSSDPTFPSSPPLRGHTEFVRTVVGADGVLFSGSNDRTIKVWDIEKHECIGMIAGHALAVMCLAISGGTLFSGGYDFAVKAWDIETRQCIGELGGHTQVVTDLVATTRQRPPAPEESSPTKRRKDEPEPDQDIRVVLSCAEDMTIRVWDAFSMDCLQVLRLSTPSGVSATGLPLAGCECRPWCMCVDADGLLYLGTREGQIQVWDMNLERCVTVCSGHKGSVRSLAILHAVPFECAMLFSASDDGTVRAWKDSSLVRREKEGMLVEAERIAQEEARAKRRAKESQELERQRVRDAAQQAKAEEEEVRVRANVKHTKALGEQKGSDAFADWGVFDGMLSHKCQLSEITVWSMGHVHGLQCAFTKEGDRKRHTIKGGKAAVDLPKGMPTANQQVFAPGEDITEVSVIVSKAIVPGVIGQLTIKTNVNPEGYKYGRTTDGEEMVIKVKEGFRGMCLHGSFGEQGMRQLGLTLAPKVEKRGGGGGDAAKPLTLAKRAKLSLLTADGRVIAVDPTTSKLIAVPSGHALSKGVSAVFTIDVGEGGGIALKASRQQGGGGEPYVSVDKDTGACGAKWGGWALTKSELFEVERHATDEGDRVSFRACNGKFLAAKPVPGGGAHGGITHVMAGASNPGEDEMMGVMRAGGAEAVVNIRIGKCLREEREEAWVQDAKSRSQAAARSQAVIMIRGLSPCLLRLAHLGTHPFTVRNGREPTLDLLPRVLADAGEGMEATLLSNLTFLNAKGMVFGVLPLLCDLSKVQGGFFMEMAKFLSTEEGEAAVLGGTLIAKLAEKRGGMGSGIKAALDRVEEAAAAAIVKAEAAAGGGFDIVNAVRCKEILEAWAECGAPALMGSKEKGKITKVLESLEKRISVMKEFPDDVFQKFGKNGHLTSTEGGASAFAALASGLASARDAEDAFLAVQYSDAGNEGQDDGAIADSIEQALVKRQEMAGSGGAKAEVVSMTRGLGAVALVRFYKDPLVPGEIDSGAGSSSSSLEAQPQQHAPAPTGGDDEAEAKALEDAGKGDQGGGDASAVAGEASGDVASSSAPSPQKTPRRKSSAFSSAPRSVVTVRDEIRAAIIKGSLSPLIPDVAPRGGIEMSKVKLMITGDDMKEERVALHRGVLAALKSQLQSHMVDFGWNDSGWGAEEGAGGDMWMDVVESESCVIDSPPLWGGSSQSSSLPVIVRQPEAHKRWTRKRRFAMMLVGETCEAGLGERDVMILEGRRRGRYKKGELEGLTVGEVILKTCEADEGEEELLLEAEEAVVAEDGEGAAVEEEEGGEGGEGGEAVDAAGENGGDGDKAEGSKEGVEGGEGGDGGGRVGEGAEGEEKDPEAVDATVYPPDWPCGCHLTVLKRTLGGLNSLKGGAGHVLASFDHRMTACGEECDLVCDRYTAHAFSLSAAVRGRGGMTEGTVRVIDSAVRGGGEAGGGCELHVYDLHWDEIKGGKQGCGEKVVKTRETDLWERFAIELSSNSEEAGANNLVGMDDIDHQYTYLCNKGHRAVVTYTGPHAAMAASIATQKEQIRTATHVHCTIKGCPELMGGRAKCDDPHMTLVEAVGVPSGASETSILALFSCTLKEVTVLQGQRSSGESTGEAGLSYDTHEGAMAVRALLQGQPFPGGRGGGKMRFERHDSEAQGYLTVCGLPWDVTPEEVKAFFEVAPIPEWSCCRPSARGGRIILAYPFRYAACIAVKRCNGSRNLGPSQLEVDLVDPSSAKRRVYCAGVPFALSEKAAGDAERALKDLQSKEREMINQMMALTAFPTMLGPSPSRLFTRRIATNAYELTGDAVVAYPHPAAARAVLANPPQGAFHVVPMPGKPTMCVNKQLKDIARLSLRAYEMLYTSVSRVHPVAKPIAPGDFTAHSILVADQAYTLESAAKASCVAGFSASAARRDALCKLLSSMCALFRGSEDDWVKIGGDGQVRDRSQLSHVGDGQRCGAFKALKDAVVGVQGGKGAAALLFGVAGCGKTAMMARFVLERRAAIAKQEEEAAAEAAKKTEVKKKKPAASAKPAGASLGATGTKTGTAKKKVEKKEDLGPQHPATTRIVAFLRQPWHSTVDILEFVIREVWAPWSTPFGERPGVGQAHAREIRLVPGGGMADIMEVFRKSLSEFMEQKYNQTVGLVLDSLDEEESKAIVGVLSVLQQETGKGLYKLWGAFSMTTATDEATWSSDDIKLVKVPPLTKAEATCIIFDEALREGHHLLRFPIRLLMGLLKNGSESPRYLKILVGLVCRRGVFDNVAQEVDALASTLPQLISNDFLPSLESIHNRDGACYDMARGLDPRKAQQQQQQGHVEQLFKLIVAFGSRGFTEGDVHECLFDAVPDRNRAPLMRALAPVLHVGRHCGHVRYALTCPYTAHAITQRYWPSAMVFRGTGCNQLFSRLPPSRPPTHTAFGKMPGENPFFVLDISSPRNLRIVRRLFARLLALHTVRGQGKDGKEIGQKVLSLNIVVLGAEGVVRFGDEMLEVDNNGECVNRCLEWLAALDPFPSPPSKEDEEQEGSEATGKEGDMGDGGGKEKKKAKKKPGWTSAMEAISLVGKGCSTVHWITDSEPSQSVERIMDEVDHLESEAEFKAKINTVSLDAPALGDKALKMLASRTKGRFTQASCYLLGVLLDEMPEDPRLKDRISDCEARAECPKRSTANPRRARAGSPHPGGGWETGLIVPPPRSAVSIVRGEVDNILSHARDSTSRGLRVTVFDQAGEVKYDDTYDTWGSISESMRLSDMLGSLSSFECVAVTSFDAWEKCFTHHAANALGKCGIDGRRMLKQSEAAKLSWDGLVKRLGGDEPSDDARPDGHGHPVAAVGVKGRKPMGVTVLHEDLSMHAPVAELVVTADEIRDMREIVMGREDIGESVAGRAVGVCKVVTPFRWAHEAGDGPTPYNTLPGHSFSSPSKEDQQGGKVARIPPGERSLNAVVLNM